MYKRGQVTIFVIIAIVIVVAAIGIFYVYPNIISSSTATTPAGRIQDCLEDEIEDKVEEISLNFSACSFPIKLPFTSQTLQGLKFLLELYKFFLDLFAFSDVHIS